MLAVARILARSFSTAMLARLLREGQTDAERAHLRHPEGGAEIGRAEAEQREGGPAPNAGAETGTHEEPQRRPCRGPVAKTWGRQSRRQRSASTSDKPSAEVSSRCRTAAVWPGELDPERLHPDRARAAREDASRFRRRNTGKIMLRPLSDTRADVLAPSMRGTRSA